MILKSTRQKNWPLYPGSNLAKHISFQLVVIPERKNKIAKDEKQFENSDNKRQNLAIEKVEKSSGIQPFLFTPEEWPEDATTQMIKTTESRNKLKTKMNILSGDETPEQLMFYLKNFKDKILKNTVFTASEKLAVLRQIVNMEVQIIMS